MENVYCIYCGTKNKITNKRCSKCNKKLKTKYNPLLEFLYDNVLDELKSNAEKGVLALIEGIIKSHIYGVTVTLFCIATTSMGVISTIKNDTSYIESINERPATIVEDLSLDSDIVLDLANYIDLVDNGYYFSMTYSDTKVTFSNLPANYKLMMAFGYWNPEFTDNYISSCDEISEYGSRMYELCLNNLSYYTESGYPYTYYIDMNTLKSNYYRIFNTNDITYTSFIGYNVECFYNSTTDKYLCAVNMYPEVGDSRYHSKVVEAKLVNDSIILYTRLLVTNGGNLYSDVNLTNLIVSNTNYTNQLIEDNIEYGTLYKNVFHKNSEGNYYWFSSEPIEENS